jgi:AcrR family transcriptional regulator
MVKDFLASRAMRERLTPRGRERRERLLEVSARLFAERGYHPTSVAEIVAALGVGKGVFYWYFSSKEELLAEILRSSHHELRKRQQAAIASEPDPLRRIELGIRASLAWFREHRAYFAIIQFAAADETFAPVLRNNEDVALADTARHVKEAIAEGRIADLDPEMLARAIHGVIGRLARDYLIERDEPVDLVADLAVAFCLRGLNPVR